MTAVEKMVCIACLFYQITCVGMRHESVLSSVINSNGADITSRFGNLVGNSDPKDSEGVCYGTHGKLRRPFKMDTLAYCSVSFASLPFGIFSVKKNGRNSYFFR